jgi:hypothetical protein
MYYVKSIVRLNVIQMQEKLSPFKWFYSYIHVLHIFNEAGKGRGRGEEEHKSCQNFSIKLSFPVTIKSCKSCM